MKRIARCALVVLLTVGVAHANAAQRHRVMLPRASTASAPLLLLIGEADDWTPAAPCKALAARVAARGEPMQIVTYPGTYHDFDSPALTAPRVRADVPNGVNPGAGVTTAPNPAAREDAKLRVKAFLSEHLH